jgi:hypothetical protein
MAKADVVIAASPGSRPLKNAKYEKYCRLRASAQPRIPAYREAGWETSEDDNAYSNGCRLERRPKIRERIAYLVKQAEERIIEKRQRLEERLWSIHESNIQDFFETYDTVKRDHTGQPEHDEKGALSVETRVRPKLLTDLSPEAAKLIEDVTYDSKGRAVPKLYSKLQASKELRAMLNISAKEPPPDVTQLSDAELIQQLADQAKQLGITIDLNYRFAQQPLATASDGQDDPVIDVENESDTPRKR